MKRRAFLRNGLWLLAAPAIIPVRAVPPGALNAGYMGALKLGTSGGGSWTPTSETGLFLWLKADAGTYTDAGTSTPTTDNTKLQHWVDQSGAGNSFSQATSGNRPTWYSTTHSQNGLPVIFFGTNLFMTAAITQTSGPLTVLMILQSANVASEIDLISTNSVGWVVTINDNDVSGDVSYFDGTHDIQGARNLNNVWGNLTWVLTTGTNTGFIYTDNVQKVNGNYTNTSFASTCFLGASTSTPSGTGSWNVGEICIWSQAFNSTQKTNSYNYAKTRWGTA